MLPIPRILQTSDTHIGMTKPPTLQKMFRKMANEDDIDLWVHNGDFCGGVRGHKSVHSTCMYMREANPDIPIVATIGNHDFWHEGRKIKHAQLTEYHMLSNQEDHNPSSHTYKENYEKCVEAFKKFNIHFIDEDGPYRSPKFPNFCLVGCSGWYHHPNPPTNDHYYLPRGYEGDTHRYLQKRSRDILFDQLDNKITDKDKYFIFLSHFQVIHPGSEMFARASKDWGWDENIGIYMQEEYDCKYFLNGHAHEYHNGPLRYESGSDYGKPEYQLIEVDYNE